MSSPGSKNQFAQTKTAIQDFFLVAANVIGWWLKYGLKSG